MTASNPSAQIILGSASPRRLELLSRFLPVEAFRVYPVDLDEAALLQDLLAKTPNARFGLSSTWAANIAQELAAAKMDALQFALQTEWETLTAQSSDTTAAVEPNIQAVQPDTIAITADTIVVAGDKILGKPQGSDVAATMLESLSGRPHAVLTGLCVEVQAEGRRERFLAVENTAVEFAELSAEKIAWYVKTGEPLDKAGAYGIQGYGSALIKGIQGCYYNVMGLPIHRLLDLFEQVSKAFPSFASDLKLLPW